MCESLRPGMTVRWRPSITRVCGPRRRRISSSLPTAAIFPPDTAIASTNDGTPFVAILALCKMRSTGTAVSIRVLKRVEKGGRGPALPLLLVSGGGERYRVFGKFCCWCAVHHGVGVLDTDSVRTVVVLHDVHHGIVSSAMGPIALPFEHDGHGRDRLCASLNDTL